MTPIRTSQRLGGTPTNAEVTGAVKNARKAEDALSPTAQSAGSKGKKTKIVLAPDLELLLVGIERLDRDEVIALARQLAEAGSVHAVAAQKAQESLAALEAKFDAYRVAFADRVFDSISTAQSAGSSEPARPNQQVTIIPTLEESKAKEDSTAGMMDKILDAGGGGPVPQGVRRNGDRVYLTFADALKSGEAKSILESSKRCEGLFKAVEARNRLFPAVVRNVELKNLPWLFDEIDLRNPSLRGSVTDIKPMPVTDFARRKTPPATQSSSSRPGARETRRSVSAEFSWTGGAARWRKSIGTGRSVVATIARSTGT